MWMWALLLPTAAVANPVATFADALANDYVFPEQGARMAEAIRAGEFEGLTGEQLAGALTAAVRTVSPDKHLYVRAARTDGTAIARSPSHSRPPVAKRLDGDIGYLELDTLLGQVATTERIDDAMRALAGSRALIIDLRENKGGSGSTVADVASWLFAERVQLNDIYWRVDWSGNRDRWESSHTAPREDSALVDVPVFVLTSPVTFSAAEALAYDLQQLKRATIVGEPSGGGAHPVRFVRLGDGLNASIPVARAVNPVSGTNWEGVGVQPDVPVAADRALDRAIELAGSKG